MYYRTCVEYVGEIGVGLSEGYSEMHNNQIFGSESEISLQGNFIFEYYIGQHFSVPFSLLASATRP